MKTKNENVSPGFVRQTVKRFCKNRLAVISLAVFVIIVFSCIAAPLLTSYDYDGIDYAVKNNPPSKDHIFGTDVLGRDIFSRILYGGRYTLSIAFTAVVLSTIFGGIVGLASGFIGGSFDNGVMRCMDALSSIPTVLLAIVVEFAMGFGVGNYKYAMAVALIPPFARLLRTTVMTVTGSEFIEAARALGIGNFEIVMRHIVPNVAAPALIHISNAAAEALLTCTVLGYIGFGISPPKTEWGEMVAVGYTALRSHPHVALIPCFVVAACVLSLNLVGNGLRDAMDLSDR